MILTLTTPTIRRGEAVQGTIRLRDQFEGEISSLQHHLHPFNRLRRFIIIPLHLKISNRIRLRKTTTMQTTSSEESEAEVKKCSKG
jgi:hypothetical protein